MTPRILDRIDRPQDLHSLTDDELAQVAQEVRAHIIDTVGEIGGHFGVEGARDLARQCHESARASLREAAPTGATELEQITDFILTRTA